MAIAGVSNGNPLVPRCQNMLCRLPLVLSDLPFDANSWVDTMFADADGIPAKEAFFEACKLHVANSDAASFMNEVAGIASPLTGVRLPLCDSCLHSASSHREQLMRHLQQRSKLQRSARSRTQTILDRASIAVLPPTLPSTTDHTSLEVQGASEASKAPTPSEALTRAMLQHRLAELRARKAALRARLERANTRRKQLNTAALALRSACDGVEARISVAQRHLLSSRALILQYRQMAWTARFRYERLRCTSLLNEAFMVTCHGQFGVINGCRLGRLTGESVSWPEINAALGHTALLVASLAKRMGVVLSRHRIIPMGSFTRICPHGGNERSATPLHYDHNFFANNRLNTSIKALGQCVLELQKRVSPSLPLPYPVSNSGETAGGVSILLTLGTKEKEWTAAIRNLLTTLKWIQAWALTHTAPQRLEV